MARKLDPITPGEILLEEFMKPMNISQNKLARDIDIPIARINYIVHSIVNNYETEIICDVIEVFPWHTIPIFNTIKFQEVDNESNDIFSIS